MRLSWLHNALSLSQTLYANALNSIKQLMEGLLQRHLDPKGLQETVHVSYPPEGCRARGGHHPSWKVT